MADEWGEIIDDVIDNEQLMRELGARTVELDSDTLAALDRPASPAPAAPLPLVPAGAPPPSGAPSPSALADIAARAEACAACPLRANRTKLVPGQGNPNSPDVMFIGEAPGQEEDQSGQAFVGAAGRLLTKMIAAMGYTRDQVFIANICKCRPPHNRTPIPEEMSKCLPFLREQIAAIRPKTIVLLGGTALKGLLNKSGITRVQGQWTIYEGIPVMPTFHPAYILRFPPGSAGERQAKLQAWHSLKLVLKQLGKPVPGEKS